MMIDAASSATQRRLNPSRKPWLLWVAPPFLALFGLSAAFFAAVIVEASIGPDVVFVETRNGLEVPSGLVLAMLGAFFGIYVGGAYGVLRERTWARPLLAAASPLISIMAVLVHTVVSGAPLRSALLMDWTWTPVAAAVYVYCYHYAPVVTYYQNLNRRKLGNR